jgi:superoxide dismutase, Cu-Zn family
MNRFLVLGALALALGACSSPSWPEFGAVGATANLLNSGGYKIGEANFAERRDGGGVDMELQAWDLPPGVYGMHIHDTGFCDSPEFQTAGGHFNPFGKKHGLKNPQGAHAGDLPNLIVPPNGKVSLVVTLREVTLREGVNSLLRPEGTSLVIHANPDDQTTDPAGNSGARMACGVIQGARTEREIEAR